MAFRSVTVAMKTAQAIAESDKIDPEHKETLTKQVLATGASSSSGCQCDNWAQRIVVIGIGLIGLVLALFVGIKLLQGGPMNAAIVSALTAAIGGLAGMFAQRNLGGPPSSGTNANGSGDEG